MKNIGTKIIILVVAIAMAVIAVMYFYKTIVSPPVEVPMINVHDKLLTDLYNDFSNLESRKFNDSLYVALNDKFYLYDNEGLITDENRASLAEGFITSYTPVFVEQSMELFNQSKWYSSNHKAILNRIKSLNKLERTANVQTLQLYDSDLRRIKAIISDYNAAYKVSRYSKYVSLDDANSKITKAEQYLNMSPLNNCDALCKRLRQVGPKIGSSHYKLVQTKVYKMKDYLVLNESVFDTMVEEANSAINDYGNIVHRYGSNAKPIDGLLDEAKQLYNDAKYYYRNKQNYGNSIY